jgi:hypothetical protein
LISDALGIRVGEIRESFDRAVTNRTLEGAMGTAAAGTCGAAHALDRRGRRPQCHRDRALTRLAHDVNPDLPTGIGDLSYRIVITGDPGTDCTWPPRSPIPDGPGSWA